MKSKVIILISLSAFLFNCSSTKKTNEGKVVSNLGDTTFHAEYKGPNLKVGDRVSILKFSDFETDLKNHQSRSLPKKQKKVVLGEGVVSSILNDNYYEFKTDAPQHIPEGAFIEKL